MRRSARVFWLALLESPLVSVSALKFTEAPGAYRLSFERIHGAIISRPSSENNYISANATLILAATSLILIKLMSSSLCQKRSYKLSGISVSATQVDSVLYDDTHTRHSLSPIEC